MTTEGTIITFYSYKGGVGRTLVLANVAALLSQWGYRVLCIDWDLEAPGLQLYFKPWTQDARSPGLVELIAEPHADWRQHVTTVATPQALGTLHFIPAGLLDDAYVNRMQQLDWQLLYQQHELGKRLEDLRRYWKKAYDFILIDSRTGVTDIGGICTIQMPDQLVMLFTANHQSLSGALEVARRAAEQRNRLPYDRAGVACVPLPTRFDGRVQFELAKEWLEIFADRLRPMYSDWVDRDVEPRQILDHIRIPYVAFWSFGEKMPVIEEGTSDPESMGFALETVTALLARRLAGTDLLVRNRDQFVVGAQRPRASSSDFHYDVFVSPGRGNAEFVKALAIGLTQKGLEVLAPAGYVSEKTAFSTLQRTIERSRSFLFVIGEHTSAAQDVELDLILRQVFEDRLRTRRIIPLLRGDIDPSRVPPPLQSFQFVRSQGGQDLPSKELLDELAALLAPAAIRRRRHTGS